MVIETRQQLCKLQAMNIKVGSSEIKLTSQVKNLGCCLDSIICVSVSLSETFVTQLSSTRIILDAKGGTYRMTAYVLSCTHSSRAG